MAPALARRPLVSLKLNSVLGAVWAGFYLFYVSVFEYFYCYTTLAAPKHKAEYTEYRNPGIDFVGVRNRRIDRHIDAGLQVSFLGRTLCPNLLDHQL